MDNLIPAESKLVIFNNIEQFQSFLNKEPSKDEIEINKMANDSKYIDIGTIEHKLDEIFSGLWKTENFRYQVIANEIVGSIDLHYYHPTAKTWLIRTGAAAVQIQMDSSLRDETGKPKMENGKKVKDPNFRISDVDRKITNTLTKDFPHLKAECIKNAAKSIGSYFGRNLNRGEMPVYEVLSEKIEGFDANTVEAQNLIESAKLADIVKKDLRAKILSAGPEQLKKIVEYLNTKQ